MRASLSRWSIVGATLGALLCGTSGCKSGVTSPTDWLSWGKKPSPMAMSGTAPKKPSATGLPNPHAATGGQTGLANNSYPNYGTQGYPATARGNSPASYDTGPYGMASHATPSYPQAETSPYGTAGVAAAGNQCPSSANSPYGGQASPYATASSPQPGAYPAADNAYRTADARSTTQPSSYEQPASGYGGQPAYAPEQSGYGQPATQNSGTPAAPSYPVARAADTTGLSDSAGSFAPGSIRSAGPLPTNDGSANLTGNAANNYPGTAAPTGYPNSSASGTGSYPGTGGQATSGGAYPTTPATSYPATGSSPYPTTSGTGQGYSSPYPNSGY